MTFDDQQSEWIAQHDRLLKTVPENRDILAAPFISVPDPVPSDSSAPVIMFVGQATRANWFAPEYYQASTQPLWERLEERRDVTMNFLTDPDYEQSRNTGFWRMWKKLKCLTRGAVIWSNVAKIGAQSGNPKWQTVKLQASLEIATLSAEVDHYNPSLVVFVTGYFGRHEVVAPFLNVSQNSEEDQGGIFLMRRRDKNKPAVLWTGHPGRRSSETIDGWFVAIKKLLNES